MNSSLEKILVELVKKLRSGATIAKSNIVEEAENINYCLREEEYLYIKDNLSLLYPLARQREKSANQLVREFLYPKEKEKNENSEQNETGEVVTDSNFDKAIKEAYEVSPNSANYLQTINKIAEKHDLKEKEIAELRKKLKEKNKEKDKESGIEGDEEDKEENIEKAIEEIREKYLKTKNLSLITKTEIEKIAEKNKASKMKVIERYKEKHKDWAKERANKKFL